jgi:hypothetical protein
MVDVTNFFMLPTTGSCVGDSRTLALFALAGTFVNNRSTSDTPRLAIKPAAIEIAVMSTKVMGLSPSAIAYP